jgi:ribosomal protein S12 methylthiotransferase
LQKLIGQEFELLVEGQDPRQKVTVGRIFRDAPEIDGLVIASGLARPGKMARVRITAASEHDLYGKILKH